MTQSNQDQEACSECGKADATVGLVICAYQYEINGIEQEELICSDCEYQHIQDI